MNQIARRLVLFPLLAVAPILAQTPSIAGAQTEAPVEIQLGDITVAQPAATATDRVTQNHLDQITRLYLTTLGREPDSAGQRYWAELLVNGHTHISVIRYMLATPEAQNASSGDLVVDAYRNALGRIPDEAGYEFWSQFDPVAAVSAISDSQEHVETSNTLPPPAPQIESFAGQIGWVDAGHGVFVAPIMLDVRFCESTNNYGAANRWSSARGAYQFLTGSWEWYGHAERYSAGQAHLATPAQQDEAASLTYLADGTRPWNASRHCWG